MTADLLRQRDQDVGQEAGCRLNARTIANRLKSFSYIYTKFSQEEHKSSIQLRLAHGNIFHVRGQEQAQRNNNQNTGLERYLPGSGYTRRLSTTYSRYYYSYHQQNQLLLNNYFNQSIVYYNNLILVLVLLFIIFTVLVLLEDTEQPYYNLSTIIFLLLVLFNLIILVFAHNVAKQFLLSKNLVYYR